MHILLTGASGFLGSVCLDLLAQRKELQVSALRSGNGRQLHRVGIQSFEAPTGLSSEVLHELLGNAGISHILHIGALSSPEACERTSEQARISNVLFTEMLASFALVAGAHMTTVSTDLVFDGTTAPPGGFREMAPPQPRSIYAQTKCTAEEITLRASANAVVRVSLLYGRAPGESKGVLGWMERAFIERKPIPLYYDEFRTPIHVRDAALAIIQTSERALNGVWHCGGPRSISRVEFGVSVARVFGFDAALIQPTTRLSHPTPPSRPEDVSLCSDKIWAELGWRSLGVEEAIRGYDHR